MSDDYEDADLQTALIKADELIKTLLHEIELKNEVIATLEAKLVQSAVELASAKTEIDTMAEVSDFDSSLRLSSFSAGSDLKLDVDWGTMGESSDHSVDHSLEGEGLEGSCAPELIGQSNQALSPKPRPPLFRWPAGSSARSIDIDGCPDKSSRSYVADVDLRSSDFDESNRCIAPSSGFLGMRFKSNKRQDVAMPPSSHERNVAQTRTKAQSGNRRRPSRRPRTEHGKSSRSFIAGVCFPETEEDVERHMDCCLGKDKPVLWS